MWIGGKKLYFSLEETTYEKIFFFGTGSYGPNRTGRGRYLRIQDLYDFDQRISIPFTNIGITEKERLLLKNLRGKCVEAIVLNTSIHGFIPLDIKSCNGEDVFRRSYEWYIDNYKKFHVLDTIMLIICSIIFFMALILLNRKIKGVN
jgi:hypothetical protein